MQKLCAACGAKNEVNAQSCSQCNQPTPIRMNTLFVVDNDRLSFLDLFAEFSQLKKRVRQVEQQQSDLVQRMDKMPIRQQPQKEKEEEKTPKVEQKQDKPEVKPYERKVKKARVYPHTLPELETLLKELTVAYQKAEEADEFQQMADLIYDIKRVKLRIKGLKGDKKEENEAVSDHEKEEKEPQTDAPQKEIRKERVIRDEVPEEEEKIPKKEPRALNKNWTEIAQVEQELARIWRARRKAMRNGLEEKAAELQKQEDELEARLIELRQQKEDAALKDSPQEEDISVYDPRYYQKEEKETSEETPDPQEEEKQAETSEEKAQEQEPATKQPPKQTEPSAVEEFFAPFQHAAQYVGEKYRQFKREDKLPLFFLTLAGVAALLFGFGFLVQYSAVTYFGTFSTAMKVGIGFVFSTTVMGIGIYLIHKDPKFRAFGSALLGLALSLNYLFIYFLAPIFSSTMGFVFILINTLVAVALALRYETRIVAVLSLVGGALSPLYLQSSGENTHIYFAYLWILVAASIFVAKRIKWEALSLIGFVLSGAITVLSVYDDIRSLSSTAHLIMFHAFSYLFTYASLFDGRTLRKKHTSISLIMLVGAQAVLMSSLYYIFGFRQSDFGLLGITYIINALPFIGLFLTKSRVLSDRQKSLLLIVVGAYLAVAVAALFGAAYRGPIWALESLVLLFAGFMYKLPITRRVAYFVLLGAFAGIAVTLPEIEDNWKQELFTRGYFNLLSIGAILASLAFILNRFRDQQESFDKPIAVSAREAISVWFSLVFLLTTTFYLDEYGLNFALAPLFALSYIGYRWKLPFTEYIGLGHFLLLVLAILMSVGEASSIHFSDQEGFGQIAMIEVLFTLWFMKLFYEKLCPDSDKLQVLHFGREIFYLILPFAVIDMTYHNFPDWIAVGLWAAAALAFALAELTKYKSLILEVYAFAALAALLSLVDANFLGMTLGVGFLVGMMLYKKGLEQAHYEKSPYKQIFTATFFYVGFCLMVAYVDLVPSASYEVIAMGSLYFMILSNFAGKLVPIQAIQNLVYGLSRGLLALGLLALIGRIDYIGDTGLIILGIAVLTLLLWFKLVYMAKVIYQGDKKTPVWQVDLVGLHVVTILFYYSLLGLIMNDLTNMLLTIGLVVHGIALMFNALKPDYRILTKLYIGILAVAMLKLFFVDLKDAEMIHKILVFIGVGVLCLVAAYFFIKSTSKDEKVGDDAAS